MKQEEAIEYIVKELAKNRNPQDIVLTLCESAKMSWPEAEKLVREVKASHGRQIVTRQSPLLIIFCVGLLLLGIGGIYVGFTGLNTEGGSNRAAAQYLVTGIGMLLGGIIGLWNTIASLLKTK
jgi:hypothetical protein